MSHAWWDQVVVEQAVRVPETSKDVYEPFGDSMLIVDRYGRRVVNEKIPYNERAQVHFDWDPVRREYKNLLLFMVWDAAVADSTDESRFRFPVPPPGETYDFVISAPTFAELASAIEARLAELEPHTGGFTLDASFAAGLGATVERFNAMAAEGVDLDFGRGETPIEQAWAGSLRPGAASASMHPLASDGPYFCVILGPGALDTKGGPVIDESARVLTPGANRSWACTAPATASPHQRDRPTGAPAARSVLPSSSAMSPASPPLGNHGGIRTTEEPDLDDKRSPLPGAGCVARVGFDDQRDPDTAAAVFDAVRLAVAAVFFAARACRAAGGRAGTLGGRRRRAGGLLRRGRRALGAGLGRLGGRGRAGLDAASSLLHAVGRRRGGRTDPVRPLAGRRRTGRRRPWVGPTR